MSGEMAVFIFGLNIHFNLQINLRMPEYNLVLFLVE